MLDLKDLRCFVATYELGGFGRAAKDLNTVQSSISARIARLENMVGSPLFVRLHKKIIPTAKGELLYEHACKVLAQMDEIESVLTGKRVA